MILLGLTIREEGSFIWEYAEGAASFLISEEVLGALDEDTFGVEVRLNPGYTKVGGLMEVVGGVFQSEEIRGLDWGEEAGFGECWEENEEASDDGDGYVWEGGVVAAIRGLGLIEGLFSAAAKVAGGGSTGMGGDLPAGGFSFHVMSGCVRESSL